MEQSIMEQPGDDLPAGEPSIQAIEVLCTAARLMLENGSETYRVEETVLRMAKGLGIERANIAAFPTSIMIEVQGCARVRRISRRGTDTLRIAQVNDISRRVEHGEMGARQAALALARIEAAPGASRRTLIWSYALAAASFSLLFGGDAGTFLVTFFIGIVVQAVRPLFLGMEMGVLFGNFAGGMFTAVLAQAIHAVLPYGSANAAIVGGIMPLLSGLLMTTAVRDTMYGDLISGMTRALEALLLAASVALGVYAGLKMATVMGGILL